MALCLSLICEVDPSFVRLIIVWLSAYPSKCRGDLCCALPLVRGCIIERGLVYSQVVFAQIVPLISLILLVISCTCIPGSHHLIMYTCACYARHLSLLYVLTGVANNPGSSCPDPRAWTMMALL